MNKHTGFRAALLIAAIVAIAGCENLAHDLHKKGGGSNKIGSTDSTSPISPRTSVIYDISLGKSDGFRPVLLGYGQGEAGYVTVTVTNTGNQASGPLAIELAGPDPGDFTLSRSNIPGIPAGGTASFTITPQTGKAVGVYVIETITVSGGHGIRKEVPGQRFGVVQDIIDLANPSPVIGTSKWTFPNPVISIQDGAIVMVINETSANRIEVESGATVDLFPVNAKIALSNWSGSAFRLNSGAEAYLNLTGDTKLKTDSNAGLAVPAGTTLHIGGPGGLIAQSDNDAGIGSDYGSGLDCGTVTIHDGTVTAVGIAAGIGGGNTGSGTGGAGGTVKIYGGTVTAIGGKGAGIGGGQAAGPGNGGPGGDITVFGGTVYAMGGDGTSGGGAGIGGGGVGTGAGGVGGTITIHGGTVYATGGDATGYSGAGIGGGGSGGGNGGIITIFGGTVYAMGGDGTSGGGAGIGGGGNGGDGGIITISGGTVTAMAVSSGSRDGAGIGGGGSDTGGDGGNVTISGGTVYVLGGIGSGTDSNGGEPEQSIINTIDTGRNGSGGRVYAGGGASSFSTNNGKPVIFATSMGLAGFDNPADGIAASAASVGITMTSGTLFRLEAEEIEVPGIKDVEINLKANFTVPAGAVLTVPDITRLNLGGNTLTNEGTAINHGSIDGIWEGILWH
jgi:hypothetical protein